MEDVNSRYIMLNQVNRRHQYKIMSNQVKRRCARDQTRKEDLRVPSAVEQKRARQRSELGPQQAVSFPEAPDEEVSRFFMSTASLSSGRI
jgi:hypothetical protein